MNSNGDDWFIFYHRGRLDSEGELHRDTYKQRLNFNGDDGTIKTNDFLAEHRAKTVFFEIRPLHSSEKCIDVENGSVNLGGNIRQWTCNKNDAQKFELINLFENKFMFRNIKSGLCLDIANGSTANGANLIQWECHGNNNQLFTLTPIGNSFNIRNVNSNKCIDVAWASTQAGANIAQWTCNGQNNQRFVPSNYTNN